MNLMDALEDMGCAIHTAGEVITSVERLPNTTCLFMTRRGVSILECRITTLIDVSQRRSMGWDWYPARVSFAGTQIRR